MKLTNDQLYQGVVDGDIRAISRLITLAENHIPRAREVISKLFSFTGKGHVVGVTGSPGAGKSTLVDQIATSYLKANPNSKVAIVAVDPSSPFSGGAVLGDRIRMSLAAENHQVFIRSLASRGALGGISHATLDAIQILDSAGFNLILVETVGVGQAEVDIVRTADTCVLVLVPGMGDSVQALKAGVLEIADHYVINKSDRVGADLLHKDLRLLTSLAEFEAGSWQQPILKTTATTGEGVLELLDSITQHREWLGTSEAGQRRKREIIKERIIQLVHQTLYATIMKDSEKKIDQLVEACIEKKSDPYSSVRALTERYLQQK